MHTYQNVMYYDNDNDDHVEQYGGSSKKSSKKSSMKASKKSSNKSSTLKSDLTRSNVALSRSKNRSKSTSEIGSKYDCHPKNEFKDICKESASGKYRSKESCINDCEGKYIYRNLQEAGIQKEANIYYRFIKELISENI